MEGGQRGIAQLAPRMNRENSDQMSRCGKGEGLGDDPGEWTPWGAGKVKFSPRVSRY